MIKVCDRTTGEVVIPEREPVVGEWALHENGVRKEYHPPAEEVPLLPIAITSVGGAIATGGGFSSITVYAGETVAITGTLDIPDTTFTMPIARDGGIAGMFLATVTDGIFEVSVKIAATGQYVYTDTEANLDLDTPRFSVNPIRIDVIEDMR